MESRLRWLLEEEPGSPCQGQGNSDRAPQGWVPDVPGHGDAKGSPYRLLPTHPPPAGEGPFPTVTGRRRHGLSAVAGWVGIAPVLPTRYTHPYTRT